MRQFVKFPEAVCGTGALVCSANCLSRNTIVTKCEYVTYSVIDVRRTFRIGDLMKDDSLARLAMGTAFAQWQHLTDAYALEVRALQRGDPCAATNLTRIAGEMHRSRQSAGCSADVFPSAGALRPASRIAPVEETVNARRWTWPSLLEALTHWRSDRPGSEVRPT